MKIAVKDNIVVLASDDFILDNKGRYNHNISLTPDTCDIYDNITLPDNFREGCFTYINGVFEATPQLQATLNLEQAKEANELATKKQALLDQIKPKQRQAMDNNSDVWAIKCQESDEDNELTTEEKKFNKDVSKQVIKWRKVIRALNDDLTTDNTIAEIQARLDSIDSYVALFPYTTQTDYDNDELGFRS